MTDLIVTMEDLFRRGDKAAQAHFESFIACVRASLPEPLWVDVPKTRDDMGGLFTASSTRVYLYIFNNIPEYAPITANFLLNDDGEWHLENFSFSFGVYQATITARNLEDAAVLSRKLYSARSSATIAEQMDEMSSRVM